MKNLLIAVLLALGLASLGYNIKQLIDTRAAKKRTEQLGKATTGGQARIINHYIHDSIEHVVIQEVPAKTAAEKSIAVGGGYLDTLTQALRVAVKQVDEATQVNATLHAENLQLKQVLTSSRQQYNDKWLHLSYDRDSNTVSLAYDVSLNVAGYWKRSWLFGQKQYYNDIFSDDPRVAINSVRRFTVPAPKQKRFGAGCSIGYSYVPSLRGWQPYLGVGLNYNLVQF